jgi:seryl-tRNA synthetase
MNDIKDIKINPEKFKLNLMKKGMNVKMIEEIFILDAHCRKIKSELNKKHYKEKVLDNV